MPLPTPREFTFTVSGVVANRLQQFIEATGLAVSDVIEHALELFFANQPIAIVEESSSDGAAGE